MRISVVLRSSESVSRGSVLGPGWISRMRWMDNMSSGGSSSWCWRYMEVYRTETSSRDATRSCRRRHPVHMGHTFHHSSPTDSPLLLQEAKKCYKKYVLSYERTKKNGQPGPIPFKSLIAFCTSSLSNTALCKLDFCLPLPFLLFPSPVPLTPALTPSVRPAFDGEATLDSARVDESIVG